MPAIPSYKTIPKWRRMYFLLLETHQYSLYLWKTCFRYKYYLMVFTFFCCGMIRAPYNNVFFRGVFSLVTETSYRILSLASATSGNTFTQLIKLIWNEDIFSHNLSSKPFRVLFIIISSLVQDTSDNDKWLSFTSSRYMCYRFY